MKQTLVLGATTLALLMLSACASSGGSRYGAEQRIVVDQAYVDAVDHASRRAGVRVMWINPPTKRVPVDDDVGN